jgi:hypothetical protein
MAEYIREAIALLLNTDAGIATNLPSMARVALREQADESRYVLHLLYANTIARGGALSLSGGTVSSRGSIEVIEDLMPLRDSAVTLRLPKEIKSAILQPQGIGLPFTQADGEIHLALDEFTCHQMIVLDY